MRESIQYRGIYQSPVSINKRDQLMKKGASIEETSFRQHFRKKNNNYLNLIFLFARVPCLYKKKLETPFYEKNI